MRDAVCAHPGFPLGDVSRRTSLLINRHVSSVCSSRSRIFETEKKERQYKLKFRLICVRSFPFMSAHILHQVITFEVEIVAA